MNVSVYFSARQNDLLYGSAQKLCCSRQENVELC